jgi:hypothetical protein
MKYPRRKSFKSNTAYQKAMVEWRKDWKLKEGKLNGK